MNLRILSGMGVLAVALSAATYASEPRLPPIRDEIIVTAKRPQIEEFIVIAKRPKELLSEEAEERRVPTDALAELELEAPQTLRLVF